MKADGGGAAGTAPDVVGRHQADETLEILARLDQRVNDRHQQRMEPGDGPALPRLSWYSVHPNTVLPGRLPSTSLRPGKAAAALLPVRGLGHFAQNAPLDLLGDLALEEE